MHRKTVHTAVLVGKGKSLSSTDAELEAISFNMVKREESHATIKELFAVKLFDPIYAIERAVMFKLRKGFQKKLVSVKSSALFLFVASF